MKIEEIVSSLKEQLKGMLTAENTETLTNMDKQLDSIIEEHAQTEKSLQDTKDTLISFVKNTGFKSQENGADRDVLPNQPLSLDDAIAKSLQQFKN